MAAPTWGAPDRADESDVAERHRPSIPGADRGDYISTSITGGTATTVVAIGLAAQGGAAFDEGHVRLPVNKLPIALGRGGDPAVDHERRGPDHRSGHRRDAPRAEERLITAAPRPVAT